MFLQNLGIKMISKEKNYILSLETSGVTCGVAISNGKNILAEYSIYMSNQHDRLLAELTRRILKDVGISLNDLSAVAVSAGPGSFTGLRIGAALAKGLCYDGNPKFIAIPTLSAFAYHSHELAELTDSKRIIAAISSHKDLMYYQIFSLNIKSRQVDAEHSIPPLFKVGLDDAEPSIPPLSKVGLDDAEHSIPPLSNHESESAEVNIPPLSKRGLGGVVHKVPPINPLTDITMIKSEEFLKIIEKDDLVCGSLIFDIENAKHYTPEMKLSPTIIAEYANYCFQQGLFEDPVTFKPLYVQEFVPKGV